jgi:hypothetical protein
MTFEYKTVGAPEKGKRQRGARSQSDRVAAAFDEVLQDEAVEGWEYLRTDLLPVTERSGWFSRGHEVHRAVMVFRRSLGPAPVEQAMPAAERSEVLRRQSPVKAAPEPEVSASPDLRIADIVRGPGSRKTDD